MVEVVFCQDIIFFSRVHIYSTRNLSGELLVGGLGGGGGRLEEGTCHAYRYL